MVNYMVPGYALIAGLGLVHKLWHIFLLSNFDFLVFLGHPFIPAALYGNIIN